METAPRRKCTAAERSTALRHAAAGLLLGSNAARLVTSAEQKGIIVAHSAG